MKTVEIKHSRYSDSAVVTMRDGEIPQAESRGMADAFGADFIEAVRAAAQSFADRRQQLEEQRATALAAVEVAGASRDTATSGLAQAKATLFGRALDTELARGQALLGHAEFAYNNRRSDADDATHSLKILATEVAAAVEQLVADAAAQLSADLGQRMNELGATMARSVAGDLAAYLEARGAVDELAEPKSRNNAVQQVLQGLGFGVGVNSLTQRGAV